MTSVSDDGQGQYGRYESRDDSVITPVTPVFEQRTMLDVDSNEGDGDSTQNCPDCIAEREQAENNSADEVSLKVSIERNDDPDLVSLTVVSEPASPCESNLDVIVEAGLEKPVEAVEEEIVEEIITPITRDYSNLTPQLGHTRQESKEIVEQYLEQELKTPVLSHATNRVTSSLPDEEIEEDLIVPIQKTSFEKIQQMSQVKSEPIRTNSPVFQERSGPKFSSLADVPVVYCDSDDDSDKLDVRVQVQTTDELLDEVRNSVEDISLEDIQYVETLSDEEASDNTEIDEDDETTSISTGPSETEGDIFSDETESDYPADVPAEQIYRAIDPSKPMSAKQNNQIIANLIADESEYFTSDSERPADDEAVSKAEELVDQALEKIEENIVKPVSFKPVEPSDIESLDDINSQSEVSFAVSETVEQEAVNVFRPATVYKKKASELTDSILEKSLIQLQSEMINPIQRRFQHLSNTSEPLSRDSPIDYSLQHDDSTILAELEEINAEKHTGDFFLKTRFAHLSESVRDSPIDYSLQQHDHLDEDEHMALKAEKDDGEPIDFEDDISIDELEVALDDSDDTESKAESIVDELEYAALRRASRASSASAQMYHCEHEPVQVLDKQLDLFR